jgi:hypothetical protein
MIDFDQPDANRHHMFAAYDSWTNTVYYVSRGTKWWPAHFQVFTCSSPTGATPDSGQSLTLNITPQAHHAERMRNGGTTTLFLETGAQLGAFVQPEGYGDPREACFRPSGQPSFYELEMLPLSELDIVENGNEVILTRK